MELVKDDCLQVIANDQINSCVHVQTTDVCMKQAPAARIPHIESSNVQVHQSRAFHVIVSDSMTLESNATVVHCC